MSDPGSAPAAPSGALHRRVVACCRVLALGSVLGLAVLLTRDSQEARALGVWLGGALLAAAFAYLVAYVARPRPVFVIVYRLWWVVPYVVLAVLSVAADGDGDVSSSAFTIGGLLGLALAPLAFARRHRQPTGPVPPG